jgi:hypothetical protein
VNEIPALIVARLSNFGVVDLTLAEECATELLTSCEGMLGVDLVRLLETFRADVQSALEDKGQQPE